MTYIKVKELTTQQLSRHILLIEEDNLLISLYGALLGSKGYQIHEISSLMMVRQFLELDFDFDILICDVRGINEYRIRVLKDMLPLIKARNMRVILIGPPDHGTLVKLPFSVIYSDARDGHSLIVNHILDSQRVESAYC